MFLHSVCFFLSRNLVNIYISVHYGVDSEGRDALYPELVHNVFAMCNDGTQPNIQFVGNLFIDKALAN